jgi:pyruvate,water dikinase
MSSDNIIQVYNKHKLSNIGSKAASLFSLKKLTNRVPEWVTIDSKLYSGIIYSVTRTLLLQEAENPNIEALNKIRKSITDYEFPDLFLEGIKKCFSKNIINKNSFAVRSSGTLEDTNEYSFAGQYKSYLNVTSDNLLDTIKKCWLSAWEDNIICYFKKIGESPLKNEVSVIIQEFIESDYAGVLFTEAPGDDSKMLIEFVKGSAEELTSGRSIPVTIYLPKKIRMFNEGVDSELFKSLDNVVIKDLLRFAHRIEKVHKSPQDIEWLVKDRKLYFVQSRPITVTFKRNENRNVWTSWFFDQRYQDPISVLNQDLIGKLIIDKAYKEPLRYLGSDLFELDEILKVKDGRIYINLDIYKIFFKLIPNSFISADFKSIFPEGYSKNERYSKYPRFSLAFLNGAFQLLLDGNWFIPYHKHKWNQFLKNNLINHEGLKNEILRKCSIDDLFRRLEKEIEITSAFLKIHRWSIVWAILLYHLYIKIIYKLFPTGGKNIIIYFHKNLNSITRKINTELEWLIHSNVERLQNEDIDSNKFLFDEFLTKYGHRSYSLDIADKRWADDFEEFYKKIVIPKINMHSTDKKTPIKQVKTAKANILLTKLVKRFMEIREEQRFYWEKSLYNIRKIVLEIANREGSFEDKDLFFLSLNEIKTYLVADKVDKIKLKSRIKERMNEFGLYPDTYPRFIGAFQGKTQGQFNTNYLTGLGISFGRVTGNVRVIRGIHQLKDLLNGEILVARSIDPSWTSVFDNIGGLVLERGGFLSHGSILAREYEIPAIAQIDDATYILKTGMKITLDADKGIINIL